MKFLCLPGGYGNAKTFQIQLGPFVKGFESDESASFAFTQGPYETNPPPGFEQYFGKGPYCRFTPPEDASEFESELIKAVRALPPSDTPEESLRLALESLPHRKSRGMAEGIETVRQMIEEEGDIDGLIGYSEGAMMAASVVLDEMRREAETGQPRRIKAAVFISGWPPVDAKSGDIMLADEVEDVIDIPTCHVMGAADPMIAGCKALYNLCDGDTAELFDHGYGHMVPRDERALKELCQVVQELIASS